MGAVAERVDGAERLLADLLCEEERRGDDGKDDENQGDGSAEGAVFDL